MLIIIILQVIFGEFISDAFLLSKTTCQSPAPSFNFTNERYFGLWYEVGKIQTAGGGYFEKDCVCTVIDIQRHTSATNGDATAYNSCRKLAPSGQFLNASGALTDEVVPGHWKEGFFFFAPKADYRVIYIDDNYAIEYDCSSVLGITNYCIHLLSKTPTITDAAETYLLRFAESLGLNTQNLDYQKTLQTGCWS